MTILSEILSSKVRAAIFQLLFDGRVMKMHMRELERQTGCVIGSIQSELKKLLRLDLVKRERDGNRLYYQANTDHPLYVDIYSMVFKTTGVIEQLRQVLAETDGISVAFVFGSFARNEEKATSDIDLMVIGSLGLRTLSCLLSGLSQKTGREINPHVMSEGEFHQRRTQGEHFVSEVLNLQKLFIKGGENDLNALGRE
jgi:predicted nucleotidyltransferase